MSNVRGFIDVEEGKTYELHKWSIASTCSCVPELIFRSAVGYGNYVVYRYRTPVLDIWRYDICPLSQMEQGSVP